ncbi:MAG: trigger factor [Alphaproteobacteria bacterium]|nr:trigger factor [Alphaproteobacteria bacterium]
MQITETVAEGLRREYRVIVPAGDIGAKMDSRLREVAGSVNIPGFRPGKIPLPLLKKRYGASVRGEVLDQTITDSVQRTVSEKGIRPALEPKIEIVSFEEGRDLEYKLQIEVLPEVKPPDFAAIALERLVAEVADTDIDTSIQRIADRRRAYESVGDSRGAESGDELVVDFAGTIDGQAISSGPTKDFRIRLGAKVLAPEFDEQLLGAKAGSHVGVTVTIPETHPNEEMRNKSAVYAVDVKDVRAPQPITIDDAFATTLGVENLAGLKKSVGEQIEREYGQIARNLLKRRLLDQLARDAAFEVPAGMIDREFESIWATVQEAVAKGGLDDDDKGKSEDELKSRYRPIAERRVRLGLLLAEVGRTNNLSVSQEDINRAISTMARNYPGQEARVFEYYQQSPQALQELQAPLFEDKVIDFILELAKVTDRKLPAADLVKAAEEYREEER